MTTVTKNKGTRKLEYEETRLMNYIDNVLNNFENIPQEDKEKYKTKINRSIKRSTEVRAAEITNRLILEASANISETQPNWTFVASHFYLNRLYKEASYNRAYDANEKYGNLVGLLKTLGGMNVYSEVILKYYTKDEIKLAQSWIDPDKDSLFTYIGLRTLSSRYLAQDHSKRTFELPQERYMVIALTLMALEGKENRMDHVKEAYWALSNLYMTVATPTLSNAGTPLGQLSSCFIDTTDDSLQGIYDSNTDIATLSKFGGGIGVYMGKVRSRGSSIRGFAGASSGVLPWIKQLNNTAISVDQLGQRQGAVAVYLDVWHKDIFTFLDLKLNNGDDRLRAHDIFTGVCLPDLFMEKVDSRGEWHLFDPYEVKKKMGYSLEDFYDEKLGDGEFRKKYEECVMNGDLSRETVPAIDLMKRIMRSQLETGVPFMFYRDEVNRTNPNKHAGMIYSSNLCTEIFQNQSPTTFESVQLEDDIIVTRRKPGDFVVCNLSSINLGRAIPAGVLERLIKIQVRMLDNVIELNNIPVPQAERTNARYRGIGLGTFGWHHLLALNKIQWESDAAVEFADELYEKIGFLTIKASMELAKEKGVYPLFEGSDWQTGAYFESREYVSEEWTKLRNEVAENGLRNGYLMAVAPNASTSILAGSTASIDPIFQKSYSEEKKDYKIPVTVPDLNSSTTWFYKSAYFIDQHWTIKQNKVRQRHIDQGVSLNLYVQNTIKAKELLDLHLDAWRSKFKTTYYVRSTSVELIDCDSCSS